MPRTNELPRILIMIHPLPTEEALRWARLHHREQAAQAERDYLADTTDRPARSHSLGSLIEGPMRVAAMALFLIELLALAAT
jgi:hypothetical protein